jgi:hypothetical protein
VIIASASRRVALFAAVLAGAGLVAGCGAGSRPAPRTTVPHPGPVRTAPAATDPATASSSPNQSSPAPTTTTTAPRRGHGTPVHVSLYEGDGDTYGVAMPIIAYFSVAPTDATVFDQVVTVKVNGAMVHGAWYFEHSSRSDQALEAHYRLPH